jgi:hypothetical protein
MDTAATPLWRLDILFTSEKIPGTRVVDVIDELPGEVGGI